MSYVELGSKEGQGYSANPFPHFCSSIFFKSGNDAQVLEWLEHDAPWSLVETDFYTQFEFSLLNCSLPGNLSFLIDDATIDTIKSHFRNVYGASDLQLVEATAHKLIQGHKIGIHNDYIGHDETHRLVVQINSNWIDENGGYLMIFNSLNASDIAKIIRPVNNSFTSFEISSRSYHAVSQVIDCNRYTVVYTFKSENN